jgi:hypothetical protein
MSSNTVPAFCMLDSCSEDGQVKGCGGVKGGGRQVDSGFVYLVSRVVRDPR